MTAKTPMERNPNESLADMVVAKLREKGLFADGKTEELTAKLSTGTATSEDWKLWVDLATSAKQGDDKMARVDHLIVENYRGAYYTTVDWISMEVSGLPWFLVKTEREDNNCRCPGCCR